jgi:Fe-S-cluster-containing hydrogenase component 2
LRRVDRGRSNFGGDAGLEPGTQGKKAMIKQKATSCDLCSDFAEPSCVYACPHDAAHRVEPRKFFAGLLQQAADKTSPH